MIGAKFQKKLRYRQKTRMTLRISWSNGLCCTNNANRVAWGVLWTATIYSATCIVLFTHRCTICTTIAQRACNAVRVINRLPYNQSWWCHLVHNSDQQTSTATNLVDITAYYSASAPSWTRTTVADGHKGYLFRLAYGAWLGAFVTV